MRAEGVEIFDASGAPVQRAPQTFDVAREAADRGGFATFMLKEIHEQSAAVARTLEGRLVNGRIRLARARPERRAARRPQRDPHPRVRHRRCTPA